MSENIKVERKGNIAIVKIDHPPANAWNLATVEGFEKAIADAESDKEVRVIIVTGAGEKCFSAGLDLSDVDNVDKIGPKGNNLWRKIDRFEKPVIAAINGVALGGGMELALCCHFRIMVDAPSVDRSDGTEPGHHPRMGRTQRLMNVVGKAKAWI